MSIISCILQFVHLQSHDAFICLSRLWSYLSKQAVATADNCNLQHGMDNESEDLNDKKNLVTKAHHGDAHVVRVFIFSIVIISFHAIISIIHLLV